MFLWSLYATSVILVLATPVLAMTLLLLSFERIFGIGVFDPALGGDPLLFQHLFWFYSHPAVYIMILPGFGVISEIIPAFSRKRLFGYKFVVWCSIAIAVISFLVWGHHMFVAGTSLYSALVFSILSYMVAVPSAIKVFNWIGTMHKGFIRFDAPMLYALGFIGLFTVGGLTGLFVAALAADVHLTQTYFVVAHFHYVMVGGMVSAFFAGLHYWWPKITGRMYPEMWGRAGALIIFIGFNFTFFPQFILGYLGMPRRYHSYPPEFEVFNVLSSAGATILAVGYLLPLAYLTWSIFYGEHASANPWGATGLEWQNPIAAALPRTSTRLPWSASRRTIIRRLKSRSAMSETYLPHEFQYSSAQHQADSAVSGNVAVPGHGSAVLRRTVPDLDLYSPLEPGGVRCRRAANQSRDRHDQYRHSADQQLCLQRGRRLHPRRGYPQADPMLRRSLGTRRCLPYFEIWHRVALRFRQALVSWTRLRHPRPARRRGADLLRVLFPRYRTSWTTHGRRAGVGRLDHLARASRRILVRVLTRRWSW